MTPKLQELLLQRAALEQEFDDAVREARANLMASLKQRRLDLGMTQQDVATAIGMSRGQVGNGETNPSFGMSLDAVIAYAAVVGGRLDIVDE